MNRFCRMRNCLWQFPIFLIRTNNFLFSRSLFSILQNNGNFANPLISNIFPYVANFQISPLTTRMMTLPRALRPSKGLRRKRPRPRVSCQSRSQPGGSGVSGQVWEAWTWAACPPRPQPGPSLSVTPSPNPPLGQLTWLARQSELGPQNQAKLQMTPKSKVSQCFT